MWSGTDGAAPAPGRVCEKVMWKWNVAELDACQRLLESRKIIFPKNKVKTVRHLGEIIPPAFNTLQVIWIIGFLETRDVYLAARRRPIGRVLFQENIRAT